MIRRDVFRFSSQVLDESGEHVDGDRRNDKDLLLKAVPEVDRKHLLGAIDGSGDIPEGEFDIVLGRVGVA